MTALRTGVVFGAVGALISGLMLTAPAMVGAMDRGHPEAPTASTALTSRTAWSAVAGESRDSPEEQVSVKRASVAFGKGRSAMSSTGRTALGQFVAGIPEDAQARVTISASIPKGRVSAKERRLATARANATANLLRRLPDQGDRISSVRVVAPRTTKARWTNRVQVTATWGAKRERPSAPLDVQASASVGSIRVAWEPPANVNRARPVTYRAYAIEGRDRPADWVPSAADASCTVQDQLACDIYEVVIGRGYTVAVVASNDLGSSEPSQWPYGPVVPYGSDSSTTGTVTAPTQTDDDPPRSAPGAPGTPTVTAGDTTATLTWTAPSSGGGSITNYTVEKSLFNGPFSEQAGCTGLGDVRSCTATGLVNGTSVRFRVSAVNTAGQGDWSGASTAVTPYGVPGTPAQPSAIAGVTSAEVFWYPPSSNGSDITGYTVSMRRGVAGTWDDVTGACIEVNDYPNDTSCSLTGLTAGEEYFFRVKATNARGAGADSPESAGVTPTSSSSAPVITEVTPGDAQLDITYTVTVSAGETVWSRYSSDDGATWEPWANSAATSSGTLTIGSLTNGTTYEVQLGLAVSPATPTTLVSGSASGRPGTTPGAPTTVTGTSRNGYAAVTWVAPSSDGGSPLVGYLVDVSTTGTGSWLPADGTCAPSLTSSSTSRNCNATGLTNGTAYYVRVTAVNSFGAGSPSAASSAVTPAGPPDTPAAPTGEGSTGGDINLSWTAPAINGSAITGYSVHRGPNAWGPFTELTSGLCGRPTTGSTIATTCTDTVSSTGPFYYTVTALSDAGASLASPSSGGISPLPNAGAPDITGITPGNSSLSVAFTYSGSASNLQYSTNGGSTWVTRSPSSIVSPLSITGLTNGTTYSIALRMVISSGFSDISDVAPGTPRTTPTAPAAPTGTASTTSVSLSWSAPSDDGGAPISGYTVQKSTDGVNYTDQAGCTSLGVDFTCTATSLTPGTAYTFKVAAMNAAGIGDYSAASAAITPVAATCATGGTCRVGDAGPGGGTVFYVASTPQSWGLYLEVAPSSWSGGSDPRLAWASAVTSAGAYNGGGLANWRLGTSSELVDLSKSGQGGPFLAPGYWSSSAQSSTASVVTMSNGAVTTWAKTTTRYVRPIRAFSPVP